MLDSQPTVLVVDDEAYSLDAVRRTLDEEFCVLTATSAEAARGILGGQTVTVILCDQRMPGMSGVEFLKQAREAWPETVRIVISGYTDSEDIIAGINEAGIYRYILKPWAPDHLLETVRQAVQARDLRSDLRRLELELRTGTPVLMRQRGEKLARTQDAFSFARIVRAPGSPLDAICELAARVALYDLSVLITGASGTGKELLARAIHYGSPRAARAFVVENLAAVPDTLIESELFGHKRGAFTGAFEDHAGLFQRADGGTIFLDEIGDTSPALQVKLLRVLQEREVRPVGAPRAVPVDVRVIAATHRDLEAEVRAGRFREDLYYRLAGVTIAIPSLSERAGDVRAIAEQLLGQAAQELGRGPLTLSAQALLVLISYPWPGNIRELRNEIFRAVALSGGDMIEAKAFSRKILHGQAGVTAQAAGKPDGAAGVPQSGTLQERLDAIEAVILKEVLLRLRWNKTRAAQELGLSRAGLRQKLFRFGLEEK